MHRQQNIEGFVEICDSATGETILSKKNAIHYENISHAIALSLSHGGGFVHKLHFGNGASTVTGTGAISFFPPNTSGPLATLYNPTYKNKIVDADSLENPDPIRNFVEAVHVAGQTYTDIVIHCFLDYNEPSEEEAFDDETDNEAMFVFDEIGLVSYPEGSDEGLLLTHCIFHPIQKSLNRAFDIKYTIRISTCTDGQVATLPPYNPEPTPEPVPVVPPAVAPDDISISLNDSFGIDLDASGVNQVLGTVGSAVTIIPATAGLSTEPLPDDVIPFPLVMDFDWPTGMTPSSALPSWYNGPAWTLGVAIVYNVNGTLKTALMEGNGLYSGYYSMTLGKNMPEEVVIDDMTLWPGSITPAPTVGGGPYSTTRNFTFAGHDMTLTHTVTNGHVHLEIDVVGGGEVYLRGEAYYRSLAIPGDYTKPYFGSPSTPIPATSSLDLAYFTSCEMTATNDTGGWTVAYATTFDFNFTTVAGPTQIPIFTPHQRTVHTGSSYGPNSRYARLYTFPFSPNVAEFTPCITTGSFGTPPNNICGA